MLAVDWHAFGSAVHRVSTTADVSPGGAFVCTAEPRPVGSALVLEMATPKGPVAVHARVAWTDPRGMGVRFTRRAPDEITV
jgi:Tfp pilus assembly protein PilZ